MMGRVPVFAFLGGDLVVRWAGVPAPWLSLWESWHG